jgi:hypothetical protein
MPDAQEEKSAETPEEESKSARRKFRLVLLAILLVGVLLMCVPEGKDLHPPGATWLSELLSKHLPAVLRLFEEVNKHLPPGWQSALLNKFGDAMVIAAILAFAVDGYVKRTLVSEVAKDAIDFAVGYALPFKVKTHLRDILRLPCVRQNLVFKYEFHEMPASSEYPDRYFQVRCETSYEILNLTHGPIKFDVRTSVPKSHLPGLPANQLGRLCLPTIGIDRSAEELKRLAAEQRNKGADTNYDPYETATETVDIQPGDENTLPVETVRIFYHRLEDSLFLDLLRPPSLGLELRATAPAEYAFEASFGAAGAVTTEHKVGSWIWHVPDVQLPGSHLYMTWQRPSTDVALSTQTTSTAAPSAEHA